MVWSDDTLKLRGRAPGSPLRVGVYIESVAGPAWIAETIRRIRATPDLELAGVFVGTPPKAAAGVPLAYRLYGKWHRRRIQDDLLAAVDLGSSFGGCAAQAYDPAAVRSRQLDVLVWLAAQGEGECAGLAKHGVWSFVLGDPAPGAKFPPYFWEMLDRGAVSTLLLCHHPDRFERAAVLYRYQAATRISFYASANALEPLSIAPVILVRRLLDVREHGADWLARLPVGEPIELPARRGYPGLPALGRFFLEMLRQRVYLRWRSSRGPSHWFVAFRRNPELAAARNEPFRPEGFEPIASPPGSSYADPFLIRWRNRVFLFVEQFAMDTYFGHIVALELGENGPLPAFPVLQAPYHLSYPCLIQQGEDVFMLPETAGHRTVELYAAVDFPRRWELRKVLAEGVLLVDTTPFEHQGVWYFFTSTVDEESGYWVETFLFFAGTLDGEWRYHPQNPICSDIRRARGAGNLFYRAGKLIRPAQDCSIRYGYAIVLNEVLILSPENYQERPLEVILPTWLPGLDGTHTLNAIAGIEVIDGSKARS
jgi:hypothetical protein